MEKQTRTRACWRSRAQRSVLGMAAATVLSIAAGGVNSYAIDFNQSKVVNLGAGFSVPIVDNDGQLSSSIDFVAPGPTGNTVYFYNNRELGFALRGLGGQSNSFTTVSHVGAESGAFATGSVLSSQTHYFGGGTLPTNIANYGYVAADNLYDGVSARFEVNGRQLISTYEVQSGSTTASIGLHFSDVSEMSVDERTGELSIVLNSGRELLLHAARITTGGGETEYTPFSIDGTDVVLDISGLTAAEENSVVVVKLTFGPYTHEYDAVEGEGGNIVAVSTAFNTMSDGTDESGADMIITRLNAAGTEVISTTIVAGEDDDIGYSVAFADASAGPCGNRLYAVGSTKSASFPAEGMREGGAEAAVLRFNADATDLQSGTLMSASGRDVAHHVIICGCDVIVVGATDGGLADINRSGMDFTTVFPAVEASEKVQEYYIAVLNSDATTVTNRATFTAAPIALPLRAGCVGGSIEIGVESGGIVTASCTANDVSEMDNWFNSPCKSGVNAGMAHWGLHALCWKDITSLTHTFNTSCSSMPFGNVQAGHAAVLNNLEVSCFSCGGCGFDPFGVWHSNRYDNFNSTNKAVMSMELLLGAAFYHKKFGSPVYANWVHDPGLGNHEAMLIRRVNMNITDLSWAPKTLEDVCSTQFNSATSGDLFDVACLTGLTGHIEFCSVDVLPWNNQTAWLTTYPQLNWDGATLISYLSTMGVYIADPPEDEPFAPRNIQEAARQLSHSVTAPADVETVSYVDGLPSESETTTQHIRVVAFHQPEHPAAMPTAVEERSTDQRVSASFAALSSYPNPASGAISVAYQMQNAGTVRLEIYDAIGQRVAVVDAGYRQPRSYSVQYDASTLAVGTYYLRLSSESGVLTMPLLIVR